MADFSHVSAGDASKPFMSAGWLNAVSDAAAYHQTQVAGGNATGVNQALPSTGSMVKIKNVSGGDFSRGHCIQLGSYQLSTLKHRSLWFEADAPTAPLTSKIAIVRVAIPDGKRGEAQMHGITTALVNVSDTGHTHADPVSGSLVMASGASGIAEILTPLSSTGEQEVAVRLGGGSGTATASVTYGMLLAEIPPALNIVNLYTSGMEPALSENLIEFRDASPPGFDEGGDILIVEFTVDELTSLPVVRARQDPRYTTEKAFIVKGLNMGASTVVPSNPEQGPLGQLLTGNLVRLSYSDSEGASHTGYYFAFEPPEPRALRQHVTGTAPVDGDPAVGMQIPYHYPGSDEYALGGAVCQTGVE